MRHRPPASMAAVHAWVARNQAGRVSVLRDSQGRLPFPEELLPMQQLGGQRRRRRVGRRIRCVMFSKTLWLVASPAGQGRGEKK